MDRAQKKAWVEDTHNQFDGAEILIITHYKGLTVAEMGELRNKARAAGATFKVGKNSLARLAVKGTIYEGLTDLFVGPTAVAVAADPVAAAKVIADFSKANEKLVLIGGAFGQKTLNTAEIQELAKLPSLDELRSTIIGLIQAPATKIAGVLQAPAGQLARVFAAYAKSES